MILPLAQTKAQTDHVLGHELVHAFQYRRLLNSDTTKHYSSRNLPLWMVEGMAEYLSIGSIDPNTAMWMRDAIVNDDFPTLKDLSTNAKYFPYSYHILLIKRKGLRQVLRSRGIIIALTGTIIISMIMDI